MRIFFLLADEPCYTPACLGTVLDVCSRRVVGSAFPRGFFSWKRSVSSLRILGPVEFVRRGIGVVWAGVRGGEVRRLFEGYSIRVYPVNDINGPRFLALLRDLRVDLVISLNCPQKFKTELLQLPSLGCVNVHFGLLPRYRGVLPIMYAILNGEREFGVTVHYMDEKLDNGDIILQETVPIGPGDTLETLYPKAFGLAGDLLCRALELVQSGTVVRKPNPEAEKTYYSYPSAEAARRYRRLARQRRRLRGSDAGWVARVGSSPRPS